MYRCIKIIVQEISEKKKLSRSLESISKHHKKENAKYKKYIFYSQINRAEIKT